jgi:hypothetical protein
MICFKRIKGFLLPIALWFSLSTGTAQSMIGDTLKIGDEKVGILAGFANGSILKVVVDRDFTRDELSEIQALLRTHHPGYWFNFEYEYPSTPTEVQTAGRLIYLAGESNSHALNLRILSGFVGLTSAAILPFAPGGAIAGGVTALILQIASNNKENNANRLLRDAGATLQ